MAPAGKPEQLRVTALLKPFSGVMAICELPVPDELRVTFWAGAVSVKSGDPLPAEPPPLAAGTKKSAMSAAVAIAPGNPVLLRPSASKMVRPRFWC